MAIVGIQSSPSLPVLPQGSELAYVDLAETPVSSIPATKKVISVKEMPPSERTFADDVVEQKEPAAVATAPVAATSGITGQGQQSGVLQGREGVATGSEVSPEVRYLYELKKLLERKKVYPQMARAMGYAGTVRVEFTLGREGEIQALRVLQGAHPILDEAAQKLVRSIEKQKPFPQEIARAQWTIEVPIEYSLR